MIEVLEILKLDKHSYRKSFSAWKVSFLLGTIEDMSLITFFKSSFILKYSI